MSPPPTTTPPPPTVYLITGASQGIGLALVSTLLLRPNTTVIATVRNPTTSHHHLYSLLRASTSTLLILKIDASSPADAAAAITHLQSLTTASGSSSQITHIDTVIANAGHYDDATHRVDSIPLDTVQKHLDVNTLGLIRLFQAVYPLLKQSSRPMFVTVSSFLGSIWGIEEEFFPGAAYGLSKAAGNWVTRKMHVENEGWVCFMVHPGFVKTGMGNACAKSIGLDSAFTEVGECVEALVKLIDGATRETVGGRFIGWKGQEIPF
ncbi:toxin biosynthesis ketoreductase [Aspergillus ellipticus CBS 707.79]|uniref:Toxin biosynthesis ketoreductase n=1 Tax=Aspergillus ellipticus CBS 707.79 TaxID=1448320 RepID=A0A319D5L8_9EURO|nr:toxin biosynthesis ketoreductase [Aspergillus ellipticus CBS 707.79]